MSRNVKDAAELRQILSKAQGDVLVGDSQDIEQGQDDSNENPEKCNPGPKKTSKRKKKSTATPKIPRSKQVSAVKKTSAPTNQRNTEERLDHSGDKLQPSHRERTSPPIEKIRK